MRNQQRPVPLALLGAAILLVGCYVQRPLGSMPPSPNTAIVLQLSDTGSALLTATLGPNATEVEGTVATAADEGWTVNLARVDHRGGRSVTWNGESVTFPRIAVARASEKRLDRTRSFIMGGLIAGVAVLATQMFSIIGGESPLPPDPIPN